MTTDTGDYVNQDAHETRPKWRLPLSDITSRKSTTLNTYHRAPLSLHEPDPEWDSCIDNAELCSLDEANILTSEAQGRPGIHKFMIDVDMPVVAIPSTQPGHWHLYIDVDIPRHVMR